MVGPPAELAPPLKAPRRAPAKTIHERAQAIVDRLCEVPLVPDALRPLLSLLGPDCLRQCLPHLPPAGGVPASSVWRDILRDQGPYTDGHWLLQHLREAAGPEFDGPACRALATALSLSLRETFKAMTFSAADGRHMLGKLLVIVAECSAAPGVRDGSVT